MFNSKIKEQILTEKYQISKINYNNISIQRYKVREKIESIYEGFQIEEQSFPKNTLLLPENDKIIILTRLKERKEILTEMLRNQPITTNIRSISIKNKSKNLEKTLREIDCLIEKLETKWKVFISNFN